MLALVATAILLSGCGWAGIVLVRYHFASFYSERLDPLDVQAFGSAQVRPQGPLIVLFGDSRAAQWTMQNPPGATVLNRGIGGQTTAQILGRLQEHVLGLSPDVVILQAGSNDLKVVSLLPERTDEIVQNCIANIRTIAERLAATGCTVIVTTVFPHGKIPLHRRILFSERTTRATLQVNEALLQWKDHRIILVDADSILAGSDGLIRPEYSRDLLHLNAAGYDALNAALLPILALELGAPPIPEPL